VRAQWRDDRRGQHRGRGLDVTFTVQAEATQLARVIRYRQAPSLAASGCSFVDDNAVNRQILLRHTASWGMHGRTRSAGDGAALDHRR